jgi:hypothetical protein
MCTEVSPSPGPAEPPAVPPHPNLGVPRLTPATSCAPSSTPRAQRCPSIPTQPPIRACVLGGDRRVSDVERQACIAAVRAAELEGRQGWQQPRTSWSEDATALLIGLQ